MFPPSFLGSELGVQIDDEQLMFAAPRHQPVSRLEVAVILEPVLVLQSDVF